ncbi:MAG: HAD family hydrolase [Paludibacterium sp.]|uniref:HAD family hydrolase n=1 Tax=Paludibacterium sp. TaxID=1917523 RepID=UPI0025E97ECA|nr:HAD family hydrolase [Paludibacterium sp.]MBV8047344.1 HAD family hydrolase [Paludibacterium sp.]MBV8646646.1 HAD family hydrolase [Paludibacterium sp.]
MNLAIFDLDNTLIAGDSEAEWPRFMLKRGLLPPAHLERSEAFYQQYLAGTLDLQAALRHQLAHLADYSRDELDRLHAEYMAEHILPIIPAKARERLAVHRAQGDLVLIITATNRFLTAPIARELGVEHLIAIELAEDADGNFTGQTEGVLSFREGKIARLESWLAERGDKLENYGTVFFYSDSINDLPLMSMVSQPVAVDPDPALRAHAEAHGWPVISLRD